MSAEIQRIGAQAPAQFTAEVRSIIRQIYANKATDAEFVALMTVAEARGLDPRVQQCYFVKRYNSQTDREEWAVQVSIDGLRGQAERTGEYDGQDEPEFTERDGRIISAKVRVYRKGVSRPFVGVAYFDEYVQKKKSGEPTRFWATMPHGQIAKCAEALAIRKAFPALGGLYTPDEMAQAENDRPDHGRPSLPGSREAVAASMANDPPVSEWLERIAACDTLKALQALTGVINKTCSKEKKTELRPAVDKRKAELATPPPDGGGIKQTANGTPHDADGVVHESGGVSADEVVGSWTAHLAEITAPQHVLASHCKHIGEVPEELRAACTAATERRLRSFTTYAMADVGAAIREAMAGKAA